MLTANRRPRLPEVEVSAHVTGRGPVFWTGERGRATARHPATADARQHQYLIPSVL